MVESALDKSRQLKYNSRHIREKIVTEDEFAGSRGFLARIADDKGAAAANAYLGENLTDDQIGVNWLAARCASVILH